MSTAPEEAKYVLGDSAPEKVRLTSQYLMAKKILGRTSPLPSCIDINSVSSVLDIAAGTCIWTLDLAKLPEVTSRLANASTSTGQSRDPKAPLQLWACDISTAKFPEKEIADSVGLKTFEQDVTKPFPSELYGTFDLVHMTLLVYALTEDGWKKALQNCKDLLTPGGHLILSETDAVFYTESAPPPTPSERHDFAAAMNGPTWRHKWNTMFTGGALSNGFITDLSYRLPDLLNDISLPIIHSTRGISPFGKLCHVYKGLDGGSLASEADFSLENFDLVLEVLSQSMLKRGVLEAPQGTKIETEEGRKLLVQEIRDGIKEEGACIIACELVAQKP
ncbi:uncharacterized protein STEHIDRAFT_164316 [Stereum hirsutum FP-91666 SS1]|uniref:uncharacterized protein n=1 Tax=Stereum hirsutum (strain FP-91666) TaxID=721885 RepID=UPI000440B60B|nr:uncharacterized protein STEHIDRAFT_164316 [Stereum hirsutum FP-91666 SS1]EIM91891.1 hypothetical protein STEHIDRAFT_164316 [Stereum hirsutum FP-91666 SS1]